MENVSKRISADKLYSFIETSGLGADWDRAQQLYGTSFQTFKHLKNNLVEMQMSCELIDQ